MSNSGLASSYYQDPYQQPANEEFRKEININSEYQQPTMSLSSPTIQIPSEYDQSSFLKRSADEIVVNLRDSDNFDPFNFDTTPIIPKRYKESTENDTESFLDRVNNNNNRVFNNNNNNNDNNENNNNIINVNSNKNNNEWTKSPQINYSLEDSKWSAKLSQLDSKCEISYSQLQFINLLGEGAFGEVWRANLWGMEVAVKKLKGNFLRASPFVELAEEVAVLKALRHPNCVLFLGFTNPPNFCIITEYMTHGSLRSLLSNQRIRITSKHIIKCALAVARGMNYLHTQSPAILHRDLTSHNILCHDNWTIKVADYGLSTIKDTSSIHFCGAVPWRAPEVEPNVFLPASDVYSFGVILWELVTRSIPYEGRDLKEVVSEVKRGIRLTIPNNCPKFLMELINNCWNLNPDLRPSFHEIIETLKPLEQSANSNHQQIVTCVHEDANLVHLRETDWILSELVVCSGNHMIGKIWTTFFTHKKQEIGIDLLKNNFLQYKDCAHHHGMLTLIDSYGRMILIVGLDSKDSLQEFDKYFHANCGAFDSLIDIICSPIISETYKLVTYNVKNNAKFAHVVSLDIKEGFGKDTLEVFENYGVSGLSRSLLSYCGSLVLSDFNSGKVLIVILYENEEGLIELENSGFFQQQMTNFSSFITSIPNIQRYHVEDDSFAETPMENDLSGDLSGDSNENLLKNNVQSIENHLIHVDEMNKQFDDHSPSSSNSSLSVSDSGHNIIHIGDHDHLDQSHLTSSLTLERDEIDKEIEEWEVVRHTPNNANEALLYYNQLLKKHLDFGFKKNKGQRYIVLPNGKRESIVRSFFCAYQSHMETGLLHVTSKYIIFESFKLVGKKSKIVMKIRHVISLDKTKYSFLPTKGHSIEITLKNDTVFRFRGLWHRDEFIELIVLLADSFHPRHTILLLTNGAPDI